MEHIIRVWQNQDLVQVIKNSILVAILSGVIGTIFAFFAAILSYRSNLNHRLKATIKTTVMISNSIPGMVIGIGYLFVFSGTPLQNTFIILIIANIVHFFSTPYLILSEALKKISATLEVSAMSLKDTWVKTLFRILIPNMKGSLVESFKYYFVNGMVTISAIIFLVGSKTMVITTKIKELQYFGKYNEIFILSILILFINLIISKITIKYKERSNL